MSKKFTGGPAFPQQVQVAADGTTWHEGMTLRDYFAAEAMKAWLTGVDDPDEDRCVKFAYRMADAMLEARTT
jgi:hypothetical protein